MAIESLAMLEAAGKDGDLFDAIVKSDCVDRGVTPGASISQMTVIYNAIRRAKEGYDPERRSASGMVGGDGAKMRAYAASGKTIVIMRSLTGCAGFCLFCILICK